MAHVRRLLATTAVTAALLALAAEPPVLGALTADVPSASRVSATTQAAPGTPTWTVELDRSQVSTSLGRHFSFVSTLHNETTAPRPGTIAYLNVVSMQSDVYVDPEDWSSARTRFLGVVGPGATTSLTWNVQAVNSGRFKVFVVVTSAAGSDEVVSSPALRVTIADERRLNPSGILPVVLIVPAIVAGGLVWSRRRRRRLR